MDLVGVVIENFQSHIKTEVDLTDGINVFVGSSNSGKSAILRAIRWNLTNQPAGDKFITVGQTEAKVTTIFKDGHSVERRRSKGGSRNSYTLLKDGVIIEEYTGFGSRVPPAILEVTEINPEFPFNFANQLESPFLLSETPKARAEKIGNLEELGKIDVSLTKVNDDIRYAKAEQRDKTTQLNLLEKEKNDILLNAKRKESKVETLKSLKEAILEKDRLLHEMNKVSPRLRSIKEEITTLTEQLSTTNKVLDTWDESVVEKDVVYNKLLTHSNRLLEIKNEASEIKYINNRTFERLITLTDLVATLHDTHTKSNRLNSRLVELQNEKQEIMNSTKVKTGNIDFSELDKQVELFTALFKHKNHLSTVKEDRSKTSQEVELMGDKLTSLLDDFVEMLQRTEVCPTCSQDTTHVEKEEIQKVI